MRASTRALRVTFQPGRGAAGRRGLLDVDPRVRTLCRVLVSYPEVRHILPDRVSLDPVATPATLHALAGFLERQRWLVHTVEIL